MIRMDFPVIKENTICFTSIIHINTHWDSMHWGHVVSKDFLHWDYLPAALAPDEDYDKIGCFSGSAIELEDGRQLLMYTSVQQEKLDDGTVRDVQTQSVAVGDGLDYEKYAGNPVLTAKDLPEGGQQSRLSVTPKSGKGDDGSYYCVIGSRPADGSGQILLYRSKEGFQWEFVSILARESESLRERCGNARISLSWTANMCF